jgi:serine protease Do
VFASAFLISLAGAMAQTADTPDKATAPSSVTVSREVKDIFDRSRRAVVKVHAQDEHSDIYGTGFFIDPTGTLYTSYSVAGDAGNFSVEFDGKQHPARLVVADVRSGIALLKVDLVSPALPIGKADDLEVATPVVAIGYPLDLPKSPSFGMIAGFDYKYMGGYFQTRHLRANLPMQRGEAGAPLLNLKGEVVGILVGSLENSSACYALPIEAAEKIRSDFVRFGEVRHGWIGATVAEAKEPLEGSRTLVTDIDGPIRTSDAGLRPGDILLQVGKIAVHDVEDVIDASFFLTAGDTVPITVVRNGKKITFDVEADYHPASPRPAPLISTWPPSSSRGIPLSLDGLPRPN